MPVKAVSSIYNFYFAMFRKNDGGLYLKFCFVNFKHNLLLSTITKINNKTRKSLSKYKSKYKHLTIAT